MRQSEDLNLNTSNDYIDNTIGDHKVDTIIDEGELVFTTNEDGSIQSGGYSLTSAMNTLTKMTSCGCGKNEESNTNSKESQSGGGIIQTFNNLLVPAGLFYLQQAVSSKPVSNTFKLAKNTIKDVGMMEETMYEKLIDLASFNTRMKHNKKTRRVHKKTNRKPAKSTRRHSRK